MQEPNRILLVEDDDIDIIAFERALKKSGLDYEVTVNHNTEEVLRLAAKEKFTCIFLDYLLPGSDGLAVLKKIRAAGVNTPVVVVTSQGNEKIAVEMMKNGALDYTTKEEITAERIASLVHTAKLLQKSELEKEQAQTSLRESQQLLANIFDSSGVGMLLIDAKGLIRRANKAFIDYTAVEHDGIINRPFDDLFSQKLLVSDLLANANQNYEFSTDVNGETKYFSVTCNLFKADDGSEYIIINFYDITSKVSYERQIVYQNTRMEALLESTNSVIFSIDPQNRITGFNNAARKVFKTFYDVEMRTGLDVYKIPFDDDNRHMMRENFEKAFGGKRGTVVHRINKLYFETTFNPIKTDDKTTIGVSVFSQDITQEKNNELGLIEAKKEAEELAKAKSQFLSNMSHEIRTPMNAIIGLTDVLLEEGKLSDSQRENLNVLKFSADNLLVIINDILDLSKIESGKLAFEEIGFDCAKIVDQVARTFSFQVKNKPVEVKAKINDNLPKQLVGDPYRLTQILNNLVSNAVKFTEKGSVTITASYDGVADGGKTIMRFDVTDTGIGIPQDKLGAIFESFTQAYTDTTRKFGGTGLGLAITKQLIEIQGGEINVSSTLGQGTTFTFYIPFQANDGSGAANASKANVGEASLEGLNVAIAEDNRANQLVIRQILSRWKINVTLLNNGREAVEYLEENTPDIVFMDLQMPEMNGFDAIEAIRNPQSKVQNHQVPVLALTADVFPETREKIFSSGMNDYLLKPLNIDELKEKLIRYGVLKETAINK